MTIVPGRHRYRAVVEPLTDPAAPGARVRLRIEAKGLEPRYIDLDRKAAGDLVRAVQSALRGPGDSESNTC